ncbi:MAG: ABC transporter ATP-binding protein [Euryarchaeota archaeon]|nr:ABC transporter ATP-binding protein [Euryarchaeota archaeon]|tara:strand:- start:2560 stop:3261 length:702 start_codon:yes stop_codon:yes gene_type:complete
MSVIKCSELSKTYDDVLALENVNLTIERGEFFGLLGPNGAGKTTLLKILTGQIRTTKGDAQILGMNIEDNIMEVKKKIAIIPEQESPPSFLTPREVLEMVASIRKINEPKIEYWIEFFDLQPMEGRVCRNLSRGQKQKVMLAAAFISETELMFLDEPFINLDPIVQTKVRDWLVEYVKGGGTVFLNTHLLENAQRLCDRAAIIHEGNIQSVIKLRDLDKQNINLEQLFHEIIV